MRRFQVIFKRYEYLYRDEVMHKSASSLIVSSTRLSIQDIHPVAYHFCFH